MIGGADGDDLDAPPFHLEAERARGSLGGCRKGKKEEDIELVILQ